jgi:hypothetical protein
MNSLERPIAGNFKTLKALDKTDVIAPKIRQLQRAFAKYRKFAGNPGEITAMTGIKKDEKSRLENLYEYGYDLRVKDKFALNWIFQLRKNTDLAVCPMCGYPGINAIDHYLAKADYPEFAFFRLNLVPTCTSCNSMRSNHANKAGTAHALLHPYFDGKLLCSELIIVKFRATDKNNPLSYDGIQFELSPNIDADRPEYCRLENHLTKNIDPTQFRRTMKKNWSELGRDANTHVDQDAFFNRIIGNLKIKTTVCGVNSWEAGFFRGLVNDHKVVDWIWNNRVKFAI